MLETIHLSHLPPTLPLYITFYHSVQNAPFLRQQLLAGNADFEYALIDASMIVSRTHILAACFRALNDYLNGRLKSRNVHSEIVFALSPNNNILEAFRKFGIQDTTTNLLVIKIPIPPSAPDPDPPRPPPAPPSTTTTSTPNPSPTPKSIASHLTTSIQGSPLPLTDETLAQMCDLGKVRKAYKIAAPPPPPPSPSPPPPSTMTNKNQTQRQGEASAKPEDKIAEATSELKKVERAVLGGMALRGAA